MTSEILKLQKSLSSSDDKTRLLAYNKDRSFVNETDFPDDLNILFQGTNKRYVMADITSKDNGFEYDIVVHEILPDQEW